MKSKWIYIGSILLLVVAVALAGCAGAEGPGRTRRPSGARGTGGSRRASRTTRTGRASRARGTRRPPGGPRNRS